MIITRFYCNVWKRGKQTKWPTLSRMKNNATALKDRGRFWHRWVRWSARLNPSPINPNYVNQPPSFFAYSSHVDTHERIAIHHHLIRDTSRISADIRSSVATHTRLTINHLRGPLQSLEMCLFFKKRVDSLPKSRVLILFSTQQRIGAHKRLLLIMVINNNNNAMRLACIPYTTTRQPTF